MIFNNSYGDVNNSANKTCNLSNVLELLNFDNSTKALVSDNSLDTLASANFNNNDIQNLIVQSKQGSSLSPNYNKTSTIKSKISAKQITEDEQIQQYIKKTINLSAENSSSFAQKKEERIIINVNETESSPLLSVKSSDDLKLSIDLNNTNLNETMGSEEFLSKMLDISKTSNLKVQVN